MKTSEPKATWYIGGIPVYSLNPDPVLRDEWQDESITEVVHYKGSNQSAVHANGFAADRFEEPVRVHESNHLALKALRQQSVSWVRISDNEERTAVLLEYQARRERGKCWYQGTIRMVDV